MSSTLKIYKIFDTILGIIKSLHNLRLTLIKVVGTIAKSIHLQSSILISDGVFSMAQQATLHPWEFS